MDNCETCCNGNVHSWGGHCDNDMRIRFEDKLGRSCTSNWLVNNHRVKHGRNGLNVAGDAFDFDGWVGFNWNEAGCANGAAFDVPNQVPIKRKIDCNDYSIFRIFIFIYFKYTKGFSTSIHRTPRS